MFTQFLLFFAFAFRAAKYRARFAGALFIGVFALTLAACGGGGSSPSVATPPSPVAPPANDNRTSEVDQSRFQTNLSDGQPNIMATSGVTAVINPVSNATLTTRAPSSIANTLTGTYRVRYAYEFDAPSADVGLITIAVPQGYRYLTRDGVFVHSFETIAIIVPGGVSSTTDARFRSTADYLFTLNNTWNGIPGVQAGATVAERSYVADFGNQQCAGGVRFQSFRGDQQYVRGYRIICFSEGGVANSTVWVNKTEEQIYRVCWQDNRDSVFCNLRWDHNASAIVALAFPKQTYRRDNSDCQSAPFYAVDSCQNENSVDVGNFAAFVSGLDGNGYRQFGIRHKYQGEDWNIAAMVSHAKGAEFLDTWWGRTSLEHSFFADTKAFAEYESGITSLRQNNILFADVPISGGRFGFRGDDWSASFGRPMHYNGKGKNAAAVHYQFSKETGFSFRQQNGNTDMQIEWRRRF